MMGSVDWMDPVEFQLSIGSRDGPFSSAGKYIYSNLPLYLRFLQLHLLRGRLLVIDC